VLDILLREAGRLEIMHIENKFIINEMPVSAIGLQGIKTDQQAQEEKDLLCQIPAGCHR